MRNKKAAQLILTIFLATFLTPPVWAEGSSSGGHWVSAWSTAMHAPPPFPGLPPSPIFENQTIRMVVRPTIGGERIRIRVSNAFGTTAVRFGSAHIALASKAGSIVPDSDRALSFGGRPSVSIPPAAPITSDPIDFKVTPFADIAISVYLPEKTPSSTIHFWGQHETYISGEGDFTAKQDILNSTTETSWYWLADVEVWVLDQTAAVVAFGDSITDGVGAKQGDYADWPDLLANRLAAERSSLPLAVVNAGIGGNRILHDGAGINALARFDRDVLAQPGIVDLIVLEGINDIGWPHMKPRLPNGTILKETPFTHELVSAEDLIMGLQQIIERGHQHGIRVFGATLTPYEGADYYTTDGEAERQSVNQWIRTGDAFDGVFDFDAAVRDPKHPTKFLDQYDSGDHLHPSEAGYKAMAGSVDLSLLRRASNAATSK